MDTIGNRQDIQMACEKSEANSNLDDKCKLTAPDRPGLDIQVQTLCFCAFQRPTSIQPGLTGRYVFVSDNDSGVIIHRLLTAAVMNISMKTA